MTNDIETPHVLLAQESAEEPSAPLVATKEEADAAVAEIANICARLFDSMTNVEYPQSTLLRQAHFLDTMLYKLIDSYVEDNDRDYRAEKIILALRIQKQCMDTLKAHGVINYMRNLLPDAPSTPHPYLRK